MKNPYIVGGLFVIIILTAIGVRLFSGPEDDWLCVNNEWVKHGNPTVVKPLIGCGEQVVTVNEPIINEVKNDLADKIKVDFPTAGAVVSSPLIIVGQARGIWYFEATFPVALQDKAGNVLAQGIATAQSDWMVENFVPFIAKLEFTAPVENIEAVLLLKRDNPSGMPENDATLELPLILKAK